MPSGKLSIRLLGSLQAQHDHNPITDFKTDSVRALLALLAMRQGQMQRRDVLADLLAPDKTNKDALSYLRIALTRLRGALHDREAEPPYLTINRKAVALNQGTHVWIDAVEFHSLLDQVERHEHRNVTQCATCLERLEQAAALVRGEFLAGLNFQSVSWQAWRREQHERIQARLLETLHTLGIWRIRQRNWAALLAVAQRMLTVDPSREQAHRWIIEAQWQLGELAAALIQYQHCVEILDEELGVSPSQETQALYAQVVAGKASIKREIEADLEEGPTNLPPAKTGFFGRNHQINQLKRLLTDRKHRLVTIVGPGGIGKTRLAQEIGRQLRPAFPDGVWFVSLAGTPASGGDQIIAAIAQALDYSFLQNTPPIDQLIRKMLRDSEMLLILDNMEQLLDDVEILLTLLERTQRIVFLCTSREVLNFAEETVIPLQGLAVETVTQVEDDAALRLLPLRYPALGLFTERAERANGQFTLTSENAVQILEIGERVDGNPLGLELAASWVRSRSITQIVESINASADFLRTRRRDVPRRQRSIRAVFETSWAMLEPEDQGIFANLAVFRGGFSAEAAHTIADATLYDLDIFVDKSLLYFENGRYSIHELLREFLEQQQDEPDHLNQQHSRYFLNVLLSQADALNGLSPHLAVAKIQPDEHNIWQAWHWAAEHRHADILSCATPVTDYIRQQSRYQEGEALLRSALEAKSADAPELLLQHARLLEELDRYDDALAITEGLAQLTSDVTIQAHAQIICLRCYRKKGRSGDEWQASLKKAFQLAQRSQAPLLIATVQRYMGITSAMNEGDLEQALIYFQQALTRFTELDNARGIVLTENNIGSIYILQGKVTKAEKLFRHMQQQAASIGLHSSEYLARFNLGHISVDLGKLTDARQHYEQVLHYYRQIDKPMRVASLLGSLGNVLTKLGQPEVAEKHLQEALSLCDTHHIHQIQDNLFLFLGRAQALRGYPQQALRSYQRGIDLARSNADKLVVAALQMSCGDLHARYHARELAREQYQQVIEIWEEHDEPHRLAEALVALLDVTDKSQQQAYLFKQLLPYISETPRSIGYEDAIQFYWRCYRATQLHGDAIHANQLLQHAYTLLRGQMAQLTDEHELRHFTERIPHHQAVLTTRDAL